MTNKTWDGASADWSIGGDWTPSGFPGTADLAMLNGTGTYVVTIGTSSSAHEFEQPGSLSIIDPDATLSLATGSTLAVVSLLDLAAGTLALGSGILQGGTVDLAGGTITGYGATLDDVTFLGTLNISYSGVQSPDIEGGLTLDTASGAPGGTLALNSGELTFLDSETLDNATVLTTNFSNEIFAQNLSLTLGSHITIDVSDSSLLIEAGSLANHGMIAVSAGGDAVLEVAGSLFTNSGVISISADSTLSLAGTLTTTQLQTIAAGITDHGVLLVEGPLENTGSVIVVGPTGSLAGLQIDGSVIGGTIVNDGSLTFGGNSVLDGVTLWGPLVVQSSYAADLEIGSGTTLLSATGGIGGTIVADSPYGYLFFDPGVTLSHLLIEAEGANLTIEDSATATFGTGLDLNVTGLTEFSAMALVNTGTIQVASGAALDFLIGSINNAGTIAVAAGGTLAIGAFNGEALETPLIYGGTPLSLAAGSTLVVGDSLTTAQLEILLNGQSGISVEILGTLVNSGATLLVGSGPIAGLTIDGDIVGGTIDTVSGTLALVGGTLDATTLVGPVAITGFGETIDILGGLSASAIGISGGSDGIVFLDSETLDNIALTVSTSTYNAEDFVYGTTLVIGAHATINTNTDLQIAASTLTNAGTLTAAGTGSALFLYGTSIVNNGFITIGAGDTIGINVAPYGSNAVLPIALSGTRSITLHPGAFLDLGGVASTAILVNLLGAQTGVNITVSGTLQNSGTTIDATASNQFGTLTLEGDLRGGTLIGAGGSVELGIGTLDGVVVLGSVGVAGLVTFIDNVALAGINGAGPATLAVTGYDSEILLADAEALSDAAILVSSGAFSVAASTPTLSIAANTTITLQNDVTATFGGTTVATAGTISTTGSYESVIFDTGTIRQSGVVSIGSTDVLGLDVTANGGLGGSLSLVGSFAIAAGATLDFGQAQTTQQLQTLLGQISNAGVAVELQGTLQNTGTTLAVGSGLLTSVILDGDIIGGTIAQTGGSLSVTGGTLSGVVVAAPLTLDGGVLNVINNTSFGSILVANGYESIEILDAESFNATTVTIASGVLDLSEYYADPLTIQHATTFEVQSDTVLYANVTIDNAGTLLVSPGTGPYGPQAYLALQAPTIVNTGLIKVAAGGTLALDPDSFGQTFSLTNSGGTISIAAGATLQTGGLLTTAQLIALLGSISIPGVDVVLGGTINNTGTILDLAAGGLLGDVELAGSIIGGTILDAGATIDFADALLAGVTWEGPLTVAGNSSNLTLLGGLSVLSSSGATPGTITLASSYDELNTQGALTLNQLALNISGTSDILQVSTLTLGNQVQANVSGLLTVENGTLINQGSINVAGTAAELLLQSSSFVNSGIITVGAGDLLDIGSPFSTTAPTLAGNGSVSLATGATLEIGGVLTTAQLLVLLGSISNSGVTVDLTGTLINTGATLGIGTSPLLSHVILDADVIGGVIAPGAGTISAVGGTLAAVTWLGTLGLAGYDSLLAVTGGLTLEQAGGGLPGTLALGGEFNTVNILDSETLNNIVVDAAGYGDTIEAGTLTLGTLATIAITAPLSLDFATLTNVGSIAASGVGSNLSLQGTSFVNNGAVSIGAGEGLSLSPPYGGSGLAIGGTGPFSIANGATLSIGGDETTAQFLSQLGSLSHPDVTVELTGSLNNTGTILNTAAGGLLGTLIVAGEITGGTIDAGTGSLIFLGGYLDDLTYQGTLAVSGDQNEVELDNVVLEGSAGGLPGTIFANGADNSIGLFGTSSSLSNVVIIGTPDISAPITYNYFAFFGDSSGTLAIAPSVTSEADSEIAFYAGVIDNAGTILVSGPGASVSFVGDTIVNTGKIVVGAGDALAFGYYDPVTISGLPGITLETGSTLAFAGLVTSSQFIAYADSLVTNPGVEVAIGIFGTLDNAGTSLTVTGSGPLSELGFIAGGLAYGGTIVDPGAASFLGDNFFDGVTWIGPVTLDSAYAALELIGTTTILSGSAAPATIDLFGSSDSLNFDPSDVTQDGVSTGTLSQNISNTVITLDSPGTNSSDTLLLDGPGTLTLAPSATILASFNNTIEAYAGTPAPALLINQGSILSTGELTIETAGSLGATVVNAGLIDVAGTAAGAAVLVASGSVLNSGLIEVSGQERFLVGNSFAPTSFFNTGTVALLGGATLDFLASALDAGTILFADGAETLRVDAAGSVAATLLDFTAGDTVDLSDVPDNATLAATGTLVGGVLDIYSGATLQASLALPSFAYSQASLVVGSNNAGGTEVTTTTPPCFLAGTLIRTTKAEMPVEALQVGMHVPTVAGECRRIVWLGHRRVDCRRHPHPEKVWPVRVQQAAFAPATPQRDLLLSPDHAVFADGVLIPIRALINGTTITPQARDEVTYFHVELDRHDILLADGLACESYLDTGNRSAFANGGAAIQLHPDFSPEAASEAWWEAAGRAPLRIDGTQVSRVRQRLHRRAKTLGYTGSTRHPAMRAVRPRTSLAELLQPAWYLATYQDVAASGMDAAAHYAEKGRNEGRLPCPDDDLLRGLGLLDPLTVAITMADVVAARIDPASHFCRFGWRERRRPNPYFDTDWYADTYDVPPQKNPLLHYLLRGEPHGLQPSPYFDPQWYRRAQKLSASQSPLAHYLMHRRRRRVSPLESFDVAAYCRAHAVRADRDPFAHCLVSHGGWHDPCLTRSA